LVPKGTSAQNDAGTPGDLQGLGLQTLASAGRSHNDARARMPDLLAQFSLQRVSQWLFAAVAIGAIGLVIWLLIPRRRDPLARGRRPTIAQERAVERDMLELMAELSEMARRVTTQIDERARRLEELIREADRRIDRLGVSPPQPLRQVDEGPIISIGDDPQPDPQPDARHQQVYVLMDEGLNARQIAERLTRPEGEIELIMALRPGSRARA